MVGPPLLLDLPGHGRNGGDAAPWRFTFDAVEAEITALARDEPLDLVGYSMGGRLALAYAVRNPGRVGRLVLESASPGLQTESERAARKESDEALARQPPVAVSARSPVRSRRSVNRVLSRSRVTPPTGWCGSTATRRPSS